MNLSQKEPYHCGLTSLKLSSIGKAFVKVKDPIEIVQKFYQALLGPIVYVEIAVFQRYCQSIQRIEIMQTNKPIVPFSKEALNDIILTLMKIIVNLV